VRAFKTKPAAKRLEVYDIANNQREQRRGSLLQAPHPIASTNPLKRAFDDVGRAQMFPVLSREVVEGEQRLAILD
jgi:hypothetical protein